jgi:hypothetical protein
VGRHLERPRLLGPHTVAFEISGRGQAWLLADVERATAGLYLLPRAEARELAVAERAAGRAQHALLLLRKHLGGARVTALSRPPGERWLVIEAGESRLVLRPGAPSPALSLVVRDEVVASLGEGPAAWPVPAADPAREWDKVESSAMEEALRRAGESGRVGVLLAACPGLGTELARALLRQGGLWPRLRAQLAAPRPTLRAPGPPDSWRDADLADPHAVALLPLALEPGQGVFLHPETWTEAARLYWTARWRGRAFAARRQAQGEARRRDLRRLLQLEAHLRHDSAGLPDPEELRRQAEALLAYGGTLPAGSSEAELADPRDPGRILHVRLDPRVGAPGQADRLYTRARRVERARVQVGARLEDTREKITAARAALATVEAARDLSDLGPAAAPAAREERAESGPRHYLTSRGLSVFVGRGARENHELTFKRAGPDDFWLHARDVPGAHVILRDREGRSTADDLREAAEVAAFFSGAREEGQADVHVARRKHVRAAGGPGRVQVMHGDTLRVKPRDPEGRLRRR